MGIPVKGIAARVRAHTAAITDLPLLEDIPALPERLARVAPEAAVRFRSEQIDWHKKFIDALQRLLRDESYDFNALLRRIEELESRPPSGPTECPECPPALRVRAQVGRWDLTDHALPHGIIAVGETVDAYTVLLSGLIAGDTYQLQLEFDNAAIIDPTFVATGHDYTLTAAWPSGAAKVVRVEFAVYPLPVSIVPRAYYGHVARIDSTEFFNVMEDAVP